MLVYVVWCALALGAASTDPGASTWSDNTSTAAWSGSEHDELSTLPAPRALDGALPPDTTGAEPEGELYTDTVTEADTTASELPPAPAPLGLPPPAGPPPSPQLGNSSLAWQPRTRSEYMAELVYLQRARGPKLDSPSGVMLVVLVILPALLFLLVFLHIIANTATPMKEPYANTKEGIVPPWMMHEYTLENVKCYPTYGQV